jgi:hypothetical protein
VSFVESNIEFGFNGDIVTHLQDNSFGYGMRDVDFIVKAKNRTFLFEVKATVSNPTDYLSDDILIQFVEKARDTYTYLHLMDEANTQLEFAAIVHFKCGGPDSASLVTRQDSLRARLSRQRRGAWKRTYVDEAFIIPIGEFTLRYPQYSCNVIP